MKKVLSFAFVFVMLVALSAQAVVIHWAVTDSSLSSSGVTSAQLVYVSDGIAPDGGDVTTGAIGTAVTGLAITPLGIGAQDTVYADPGAGAYYVVFFNNSNQYKYSTTSLAWDDTENISQNEFIQATSYFDPGTDFSGWTPVPEPGSAAMLALGVALMAMRRKKKSVIC